MCHFTARHIRECQDFSLPLLHLTSSFPRAPHPPPRRATTLRLSQGAEQSTQVYSTSHLPPEPRASASQGGTEGVQRAPKALLGSLLAQRPRVQPHSQTFQEEPPGHHCSITPALLPLPCSQHCHHHGSSSSKQGKGRADAQSISAGQNHATAWVGRDLEDHPDPTPLPQAGTPSSRRGCS